MNRDNIVDIIRKELFAAHSPFIYKAADRILAALDKEREGEVVVGEAKATNFKEAFWCFPAPYSRVARPMMEIYEYREKEGIKGQLIFRPTKEKI